MKTEEFDTLAAFIKKHERFGVVLCKTAELLELVDQLSQIRVDTQTETVYDRGTSNRDGLQPETPTP